MTIEQKDLLLYVEHCATDDYGFVDEGDLRENELQQLREWHDERFVSFVDGRVSLSAAAFAKAHRLRFEKAQAALKVDRKLLEAS